MQGGDVMPAIILQFPEPPKGNGALEVVADYLERVHVCRTIARGMVSKEESDDALPDADYFLAWLWSEGFKIVPIDADE
jgi:hypothetical protein